MAVQTIEELLTDLLGEITNQDMRAAIQSWLVETAEARDQLRRHAQQVSEGRPVLSFVDSAFIMAVDVRVLFGPHRRRE